jgi:hypothetical protein
MVAYADRISINYLVNPAARPDIKILVVRTPISMIVPTRILSQAVSGSGSNVAAKAVV